MANKQMKSCSTSFAIGEMQKQLLSASLSIFPVSTGQHLYHSGTLVTKTKSENKRRFYIGAICLIPSGLNNILAIRKILNHSLN